MANAPEIPDIADEGAIFDAGDVANLTILVRDSTLTLVDPATLVVRVDAPGVNVSYTYTVASELTRISVGTFQLLHDITKDARHYFGVITTGPKGTQYGYINVRKKPKR